MDWYLWLLVAIGSVVLWFLMGAIASFLWSEIRLCGLSPREKKRKGKQGSRLIFDLGPLGLLAMLVLLIFGLVVLIFLIVIEGVIPDGRQKMLRSSSVRTLTGPFRRIARI